MEEIRHRFLICHLNLGIDAPACASSTLVSNERQMSIPRARVAQIAPVPVLQSRPVYRDSSLDHFTHQHQLRGSPEADDRYSDESSPRANDSWRVTSHVPRVHSRETNAAVLMILLLL